MSLILVWSSVIHMMSETRNKGRTPIILKHPSTGERNPIRRKKRIDRFITHTHRCAQCSVLSAQRPSLNNEGHGGLRAVPPLCGKPPSSRWQALKRCQLLPLVNVSCLILADPSLPWPGITVTVSTSQTITVPVPISHLSTSHHRPDCHLNLQCKVSCNIQA